MQTGRVYKALLAHTRCFCRYSPVPPDRRTMMSTLNHSAADESKLLSLHAVTVTEELTVVLPLAAVNDAQQKERERIAAIDALARCMEDGALGG